MTYITDLDEVTLHFTHLSVNMRSLRELATRRDDNAPTEEVVTLVNDVRRTLIKVDAALHKYVTGR